jgi:diadenylate cyclase
VDHTNTIKWILQIAILATGIYMFLRFLRTTRGGGLIRGLLYALIFGVIGLFGLAAWLDLQELLHIIEAFTPYLAVILVILFHPELRRGITRLGQQRRFARLISQRKKGTVTEVAQAARAMASRRHGALIAFQREMPLDAWSANAAHLDAEVSKLLLQSIFHPGSALHDGAVVVDGDRIVAAACLLPLTESIEISKSTGTRHRAALGLTEETDAVVLLVSEETGAVSLCHQGVLDRDVHSDKIESRLRARLGLPELDEESQGSPSLEDRGSSLKSWIVALFSQDLLRKAAAIVLASGLIYRSHGAIVLNHTWPVQVRSRVAGSGGVASVGFLDILMPDDSFHLVAPKTGQTIRVWLSGTRTEIEDLGGGIGGVVRLGDDLPAGPFDLSCADVSWMSGTSNLAIRWDSGRAPRIELQSYGSLSQDLRGSHVAVNLGALDGHYTARAGALIFEPTSIELEGPRAALAEIEAGTLAFQLEPLSVSNSDKADKRVQLRLHESLVARDISLAKIDTVGVTLPIEPASYPLPSIERDVVIRNMSPSSEVDPKAFSLAQSDQLRQFSIEVAGIFDSAPDTEAYKEASRILRSYIDENLRVFVDVSELQDGGTSVPLRWMYPDNWCEQLFPGLEGAAVLRIEPVESALVKLTPKT